MDLLIPEYNVLKVAGSTLGYKHTEETLSKLRGHKLTAETIEKMRSKAPETIEKMRKSKSNRVLTEEHKRNIGIAMKAAVSEFNVTTKGVKVVVFNLETHVSEEYPSIRSVAQALGAHMETIRRCIKANKLYLNKYSISIKIQNV